MGRKIRKYEAEGIVVEFEAARCIHAAECVRGLPAVFDPEARPWVDPTRAEADAISEVVRRCPTGALGARRLDGGAEEEPPSENRVRIVPNGPLYASGRLRLHLATGEVLEETRVALCRCGGSNNKPFCDNRHLEIEFRDAGVVTEHKLGDGADEESALNVRLAPNGPILLAGPVTVEPLAADGASGSKAALCRCGESGSKPYCDGAHTAAGFVAD